MTTQTFTPNPVIYSVFPSNKVCLTIEDCTHFDSPKIRLAIIPTAKGTGEKTEFYMDMSIARVYFSDLAETGQLRAETLFKKIEGKTGEMQAFDLFAKIGANGHRSITTSNMTDGVYTKIINKNGATTNQTAALGAFQARVMGQAVTAYISQVVDLYQIAVKAAKLQAEKRKKNGQS